MPTVTRLHRKRSMQYAQYGIAVLAYTILAVAVYKKKSNPVTTKLHNLIYNTRHVILIKTKKTKTPRRVHPRLTAAAAALYAVSLVSGE